MSEIKPTVHDALRDALALQQHGHLADAEKAYFDLLARFGSQPDAEHMLGVTLHALGRSDESLPWFERAEQNRSGTAIWNNHAAALLALGRASEAGELALRAINAEPRNAGAWLNRGLAFEIEREVGQAVAALTQSLLLKPANAPAARALARCNLVLGDPLSALAVLRAIPESQDEATDLLRASALIESSDAKGAAALLRRIGKTESDDLRVVNLQARIAAANNASDQALALYERVLAVDADDRQAIVESAQLLIARGKPEGVARLGKWLESHPDDNAVAGTYFVAGNYLESMTPSAQLAEHRRFPLAVPNVVSSQRTPSNRLRVGWVKGSFGADLSAIFLEEVFARFRRSHPTSTMFSTQSEVIAELLWE